MDTKKILSEEIIIDLQDYIQNPIGFVLINGENGRGKSFAAMHIYQKLTPYKLPARDYDLAWFINQADLNLRFNEANDLYGNSTNLLKQAYKTNFFVIDDLGTRTPSVAFADFLYAIIDYRWNARDEKGTMITTNLGSVEIRKKFGDAIFSRIASGRNYVATGPDRRFDELGF